MKRLSQALLSTLFVFLFSTISVWAQGQTTVTPAKENHYAQYVVQGSIDDFWGYPFFGDPYSVYAGEDQISVTFPAGTVLPASIDPSFIQVKGVDSEGNTSTSVVASTVTISGQTVSFTSPVNMGNNTNFEVTISAQAKIRNPAANTGYQVSYDTDLQNANTTSAYTINANDSQLSQPSVSLNPAYEGFSANYIINFTTGPGGYMAAGNTIDVTFPNGTNVPSGALSSASVLVNGTTVSAVSGNTASRTLTITTPEIIDNSENVTVRINSALGVENPSTSGSYTLDVNTTAEPTAITSSNYSVISLNEISIPNVTLLNSNGSLPANTVNATSEYRVSFRLGTNEDNQLATGDIIKLTFPQGTFVPSSIDRTDIQISSDLVDNPQSVSVSGQTVTMTAPYPIGITDEVTIKFAESIGLINPPTAQGYTIQLETQESGTNAQKDLVTSNSYYLTSPPSIISPTAIALSNTAAGATSTYDIDFTLGTYGRLVGGLSDIVLDFPAGTSQNAGSFAVTVNGTGIGSSNYNYSGTTLTISLPSGFGTLPNQAAVNVVVDGVNNPPASSYTLGISTTTEQDVQQSGQYLIGATPVTLNSYTLGNTNVNRTTSIDFSITTQNPLINRSSGFFSLGPRKDYIRLILPEGTTVPANIAASDVTLDDGTARNPSQVNVNPSSRIIDMYVPDFTGNFTDEYPGGTTLNISIAAGAGIQHPSVPTNTYKLKIYTSQDLEAVETAAYTLSSNNSSVVAQTATAVPNVVGNGNTIPAKYIIPFSTGQFGKLQGGIAAGSNTITVEFPTEVVVPGTINPSSVKLDGSAVTNLSVNGQEVTITVPDGVTVAGDQQNNSQQSVIEFLQGAGIENGDEYGNIAGSSVNVDVRVKTDAESTYSTDTGNLTLIKNSELTLTQIILSQNEKNANSAYTIKFRLGSSGALSGGDKIQLDFPAGTTIPSFPTSYALINGQNPNSVSATGNQLTLTLPTGQNLNTDTDYTLQLYESAGITNPASTGTYTLDFTTKNSSNTTIEGPKTSPSFDIVEPSGGSSGTVTITQPSVSISDIVATNTADYTINFETGSYGALTSGTSTITIDLDAAYNGNLGGMSATVNGQAATTSITGSTVDITVPGTVTIGSETAVTVVLSGVTNPGANSYTLDAYTSEETTAITSNSYTIQATSNPITFNSVTLDPTSQLVNQPFHLTVQVTPNSNASSITLRLPESTFLNPVTNTSQVTVDNGITLSTINVSQANSEITFDTGANADFQNGTTYTLEILATSGSRNPKLPTADLAAGNYTLSAYTDTEPEITTVTADGVTYNYEILAVSDANTSQMKIVDITTSALGQYNPHNWNWQLETGSFGALKPGEGYINLILPADRINVPSSVPKSAITINSLSQPKSVTVDASSIPGKVVLRLVVPANVSVGNNSTVSVYIAESSNIYITAPNAKQQAASTDSTSTENGPVSMSAGSGDEEPSFLADTQNYGASSSSETSPTSGNFNPLPITLTEFAAKRNPTNGNVELSWKTATERENYGFQVHRSFLPAGYDDKKKREMSSMEWEECGFVEGHGTTTKQNEYTYVDEQPLDKAGTYLYKLVQVDYDGNETNFGPAEIDIEAPEKFELSQNYPNPFNPTTVIPYSIPEKSNVSIRVFNILGQSVQTLYSGERQPGRYEVRFDGRALSSGVYFIRLQAKGNVFTKKMMLVK
jgi:hypothetical protein